MPRHDPPISRPARRAALLPLALALAACHAPTGTSVTTGPARVVGQHEGDGVLVLTNRTDAPVFTQVLGSRTAPLALWGACVDAARCPTIAPGASRTVTVRLTAPDGGRETEALVYWWHAVRGPDGTLRPDSIRTEVVGL